jgi:hypothetical protein
LPFFPAAKSAEAYRPWMPCVEGASCVKVCRERRERMGKMRGEEQDVMLSLFALRRK